MAAYKDAVSLLMMLTTLVAQPTPPLLEGRWRNLNGSVTIAITPCGEAMCGRVEWASDKAQADARKGGTSSLVGTEVLSDFVPKRDGSWEGRLFVPDLNKRSKARLRLIGPDEVKVTGCAIARLVCKSVVWSRMASD